MSDPLGLLQSNNQPKPNDPLGLLPSESDPLGLLDKPTSTQPKPAKPFLSKVQDTLSAIGQNTIDLEEAEQRGQRAVGETGLALSTGMAGAVIGPTAMVVERLKTPGGGYPKIFDKEAAARAKRVKEGTQDILTYQPKNEGAKALLESIDPYLSAPAVLGNLLERDPKKAESYGQGLPAGLDKAGRVVGGTLREAGEPIRHALSSYGLGEGVVEDLAKTGLEFYGYGKAAQGMKAVPKKLTSIKDFGKRKWAELTVKERGLVVQSLDDLLAKGYSEAEILRKWGNPELFAEALKRRAIQEQKPKPVDLTRRRDLKPDDMEALPPASYEGQGQGFVMSDPKQASILRKAEREPDYTVGTIPENLIVEYKPIFSSSGSPFKTQAAAEKAAIKNGLTNNFEVVTVDGGYGYRKLGVPAQRSVSQARNVLNNERGSVNIGDVTKDKGTANIPAQDKPLAEAGNYGPHRFTENEPMIVFHNSPERGSITIMERDPNNADSELFGGIFAGPEGGMGGEYTHAVILDKNKIMTSGELLYGIDYNSVKKILKNETGLNDAQVEQLYDYVTEDKEAGVSGSDSKIKELFGTEDRSYASWEAQRLRGVVARKLGYEAVEMSDETGTSYLIFPGKKTEPLIGGESKGEAEARIYDAWKEFKSGSDAGKLYERDLKKLEEDAPAPRAELDEIQKLKKIISKKQELHDFQPVSSAWRPKILAEIDDLKSQLIHMEEKLLPNPTRPPEVGGQTLYDVESQGQGQGFVRKLGTEQQVSPQQELPQTTYKAEMDASLRKGFDIKSDRDTLDFVLDAMKSDLLAGEKGGFKGYDEAGDAVYLGSGHAKWYRDLTKEYANAQKSNTGKAESFSAAQLVNIIDKGIKGDKLTERQIAIWERLNRIADTEARKTYAPLVENYEKGLEYDNINKVLEVTQVDPGRIAESKLDLVADLERKAIQEGVDSEAAAAEVESFFQSIADAHHVGKERRKNFVHRKRIAEMSVDELRTALQTDHLTGQANKRAYDEGTRQPYQVSIDVDGLKYVNDKFGHSAGNDLLVAVGDALSQAAKDVKNYHIHGDEFVLEGADPVQLTNILQEARRTLKNNPLKFGEETYAPDFSYGIAETLEQADKLMQAHKAQRRVVRGEKIPPADLPSVETVTKPSEKAVSAKEETATLEGMSEADTFTLTNPETEFSDYLPIQAAANQPMLPAVFDAQKTVSTIKSLKDSPQDAVPYLTDLGKNVIQEGNASFISWSKGMKEYLGDAWESFKPVINEVWKVLQDTIKNERGSITIPNPNDIKSTLNNIWNTTVKSRKIVDQLPDAKIRHRYILTPHWYAEEYPAFRKYFNRERQRVDERTTAVHEYLQEWASARELNSAKQKELASLIWDMEYRKIDSVTEPLYRWSETADGKPLVDAISLKHIRQVGEHLSKQGKWSPEVISAFLDIQKYFAKTRAEILNILSKSKEVEPETIEYYRQQVGAIPFYFPHNRYGNYRVKGVDKDGNTIYRQHYYDVSARGYSVRGKSILDEAKKQFPGEDIQWSVSKVKQMPEEFFEYPIPVEAMGRILQEAAARAKDISPEAANLFEKVLPQATADIIKSRGFGQRMITRENIPGFEKENILQVLYDHSQGLAGWKSKMSAARDMSKMLMEGKRTDTPNVTSYAMRYIRDVMSNADRIDRVVDNIRAYYYWTFLWGNLKSGAVNLTQLAATGVPVLSYHSNSIQAARLFPASVNALTNMIKTGKGLTPEEAKFLLDEFNTGRLQDQYIQEVKGKISGPFAQTVQKAMDVGGWPMSVTERFIRSGFTLTAYRIARSGKITNPQTLERYGLEKGKPATDAQAREFALDANDEANVVFGKSNLPELLRGRGKILRPAYSLMSFYTGFILLLRKFLSAKSGWRGKKSFIQSMIGLISLGGVVSAPFYKLLMRYFREEHGDDYEKALREKIPDAPFENKDLFRDSIMYGMPAALGVDIGGSLDMGPFSYSDGDSVAEKIMKSIIGVPYSTVESVERAGKALSSGEYLRAVEAIAPKAIANLLVARRLYTEGQRTTSGKPVNLPGEVDARKITLWEAIAKSFGFQPVSATKSYQVYTAMQELQEFVAQKRRSFADRYANASARDDQAEMDRVMDEVSAWNEKWFEADKPEYVINLRDSIRTRTQTAQPPRRFRALGEEYKNLYGN